MGRPDLVAPTPGPAVAARRTLARLRSADVHRVAERARRDGLGRLLAVGAAQFDPLDQVDDRLRRGLDLGAADELAASPTTSPRRIIEPRSTEPTGRRRAPLALRRTMRDGRRAADDPGTTETVGARRAARPRLDRAAAAAPAATPPPMDPSGAPSRRPHPLAGAFEAARRRPIGAPDAAVARRLAERLPQLASPSDRRRRTPARPSGPSSPDGARPVPPGTAAVDPGARTEPSPEHPAALAPDRMTHPRTPANGLDPVAVQSAEAAAPRRRVVGLAGLAEHFDPVGGAAAPAADAEATTVDAGATAVDRGDGWGTSPGNAGPAPAAAPIARTVVADALPDDPRSPADHGVPASDLVIARRLADLIGDVVTADARRQGIDLDGIHRP